MPRNVEMTVLVDNAAAPPLAAEWGLSILIAADGMKLLLDTGAGEAFAQNARRLGVELADVDVGVLSHAHYDHADGLEAFFARNRKAPFLLREGCGETCCALKDGAWEYIGVRRGVLKEYEDRIRYVGGVYAVADGIWLVPHRGADYSSIALRNGLYTLRGGKRVPDDFAHEQSLVIETEKGLLVFNSCSHTGVANVLADVREALGRADVYAYVGGLHLFRMTDGELEPLCDGIGRSGIRRIFTGHCTGDRAFEVLKARLGDRIEQFSSGFSFRF